MPAKQIVKSTNYERELLDQDRPLADAIRDLRKLREGQSDRVVRAIAVAIATVESEQRDLWKQIEACRRGFTDAVGCHNAGTHSELFNC